MNRTIGEILVSVVEPIVPIFLNQAEENVLPYSVYEISESEQSDKQGPYQVTANITLYIVAADHAKMKVLSQAAQQAIKELKSDQINVQLSGSKDASDESSQWANKTDYIITKLI